MEKSKIKKFSLVLPIIAILAFVMLALTGCNDTPTGLTWKTQFEKSTYYIGETLDVSGGVVNYTDDEGNLIEKEVVPSDVTNFDTTSFGEKEMTVTVDDKTLDFSYTVKNLKLGTYQGSQMVTYDVSSKRSSSSNISYINIEFNSDSTCTIYEQGEENTVSFEVYSNGTMSILSPLSYYGYYSNNGLTLFVTNEDVQDTQTTLYFNFVG